MSDEFLPTLDPCRCCEVDIPKPKIHNRPGLPTLAYRIGTHGEFLRRMLARLPLQTVPPDDPAGARPLAALTTRRRRDPAIAFLDAWAMVADVLAFYQERIANEGFLRTAAERRSVLELARSIGYELRPGVAASAHLAFTVEAADGSPGEAVVPAGTKIQSVPAKGELPQTFETSEELTARAEWNALRPQLTQPQTLAVRDGTVHLVAADGTSSEVEQVYLNGTRTHLKPGDMLLFALREPGGDLETLPLPVVAVTPEPELDRTRIDFTESPPPPPPPKPLVLPVAMVTLAPLALNQTTVQTHILGQTWKQSSLQAFVGIQSWPVKQLAQFVKQPLPPPLPPAGEGVFAFRERAAFFGNNAPRHGSLPDGENLKNDPYSKDWDDLDDNDSNRATDIWMDSQGNDYRTRTGFDAFLERAIEGLLPDSWAVLRSATVAPRAFRVGAVTERSLADYSLSGKCSGVQLAKPDGDPLESADKSTDLKTRSTTAHVRSERLTLADLPVVQPLAAGDEHLTLNTMVFDLEIGQALALTGERDDLPGVEASEIVVLEDIVHTGGLTTLVFTHGLRHPYVRSSVTLNANVALATHGETVAETLGGGDAAQANQKFTLKKPPLTYVAAATATGTQSTLEVRVDGVLWEEAPRLFGLDERSRNYLVRHDDAGSAAVIFGDGDRGARPPTGEENVTAVYRTGIGFEGLVGADSLTLLQTRPFGVRGVTNPLPASGADEPERLDDARANAPLTVLTMERIVSLQDFEDFARAFSGVGKAQATALRRGPIRLVHVTIAAANGEPVEPTAPLYTLLKEAIAGSCDPSQRFELDTFQRLYFDLQADLRVDPRRVQEAVLDAAEAAVRAAFSFPRRRFGQPVSAAEVVTVLQDVPGVIAVNLNEFRVVSADEFAAFTEGPTAVLPAERARWKDPEIGAAEEILPAQLLLVNPAGISLDRMQP